MMSSFLRFFSRCEQVGFCGSLFAELSDRAFVFRTELLLQPRRPPAAAHRQPDDDDSDHHQGCDENP